MIVTAWSKRRRISLGGAETSDCVSGDACVRVACADATAGSASATSAAAASPAARLIGRRPREVGQVAEDRREVAVGVEQHCDGDERQREPRLPDARAAA